MKKLLVVFLLFLCGGCAARRIYLPQVSSPAAEQSGVSFQGVPFQTLNGTPFFCRLIAGGKDLGTLGPGDLVYDERHFHNLWYQYIPVTAICYWDAAMTKYVGAAGRVLALGGYTPAEWTIRTGEIRTPDGRPLRATSVPTTAVAPNSRRIKLPREYLSTTGVQVVNNTTSDISVFLNGVRRGTVKMGGVDYIPAEVIGNYARPLIITITGAGNCAYAEQVWVQRYSQYARQIVFEAGLCGWSRR